MPQAQHDDSGRRGKGDGRLRHRLDETGRADIADDLRKFFAAANQVRERRRPA